MLNKKFVSPFSLDLVPDFTKTIRNYQKLKHKHINNSFAPACRQAGSRIFVNMIIVSII